VVGMARAFAAGERLVVCLGDNIFEQSQLEAISGSVRVPMLVVQGARDPFGIPPSRRGRTVVTVSADHALRTDLTAVDAAVRAWLARVLR
ncbi:MAG: hypothetical protein WAU41_17075, partial [Gaiellaceae bacterium]